MIDAGVDLFVRQQPVQELPLHAREIGSSPDRAHEPQRPFFCVAVREVFKNRIFKSREGLRDTEARLVFCVIAGVNGAADRATFALVPVLAFDDFIGVIVLAKLSEDCDLLRFTSVVGNHCHLLFLSFRDEWVSRAR